MPDSRPANEPAIHADLARRLVASQFPHWAHLPVKPVAVSGWDNRTFHLGETMSIRLPSAARYAAQVEKEQRWLPVLAPLLPLPIPTPLAQGKPDANYPWPWSVYQWIEGETASLETITDLPEFAAALARFLTALQQIGPAGGPTPGQHNFYRGGSLEVYDGETRHSLSALSGEIDTATAAAVWQAALDARWQAGPVWVHGDIAAGNLLVQHGRLSAVIDFGSSAVGDPACDLAIAWTLFSGASRAAFQANLALDPGTWARGRGWALWKALITLAEYRQTDQQKAAAARSVINEVLDDFRRGGG
jgi:aminoglycoside phosphotransferase (APT) family kinase protein